MSSCMDFIGNQWLVDKYLKAADVQSRGQIVSDLVDILETDGLSRQEALVEVRTVLGVEATSIFIQQSRHVKPV